VAAFNFTVKVNDSSGATATQAVFTYGAPGRFVGFSPKNAVV